MTEAFWRLGAPGTSCTTTCTAASAGNCVPGAFNVELTSSDVSSIAAAAGVQCLGVSETASESTANFWPIETATSGGCWWGPPSPAHPVTCDARPAPLTASRFCPCSTAGVPSHTPTPTRTSTSSSTASCTPVTPSPTPSPLPPALTWILAPEGATCTAACGAVLAGPCVQSALNTQLNETQVQALALELGVTCDGFATNKDSANPELLSNGECGYELWGTTSTTSCDQLPVYPGHQQRFCPCKYAPTVTSSRSPSVHKSPTPSHSPWSAYNAIWIAGEKALFRDRNTLQSCDDTCATVGRNCVLNAFPPTCLEKDVKAIVDSMVALGNLDLDSYNQVVYKNSVVKYSDDKPYRSAAPYFTAGPITIKVCF